jgi:pimeloyl-ACP methyl ester carboxylesterase
MNDDVRGLDQPLGDADDGHRHSPPVVLLHGVGTTRWMWRRLITDLAGELHVVSVDLPGHGASAQTPWTSMTRGRWPAA